MTMSEAWAVDTIAVGPVSAGTIAWQRTGQLWATVVAKMTFPWNPGGVLEPTSPEPLYRGERHIGDSPGRSIRAASDLCPFLELADVIFVGSAHAPRGQEALMVKVRLAVVKGAWFLLEKNIVVYGDRAPGGGGPKPFKKMPIVYEKSFGGAGNLDNPLGVPQPNIVYEDPGHEAAAAALAPLSWYWPSRKRGLKAFSKAILEAKIPELPADINIACFQAAPEDQRIPFFRGEELILLNGVHPDHEEIMMRLPALRGLARVYTAEGVGATIALQADTLLIDGEAERCTVTCRGNFTVTEEAMFDHLGVAATIEVGENTVEWPDRAAVLRILERRAAAAVAAARPAPTAPSQGASMAERGMGDRTVELRSEGTVSLKPATPFWASSDAPTAPLKRFNEPPKKFDEPPKKFDETLVDQGTMRLKSADILSRTIAAPFKIAAPGTSVASSDPIPGAPWAAKSDASAPPARGARLREQTIPDIEVMAVTAPELPTAPPALVTQPRPTQETMLLDSEVDEDLPAAAASPAPPPPLPAAPPPAPPPAAPPPVQKPEEPPAKPAWSWAAPEKAPEAAAKPPAPPKKPPPPPAVKNKLYGSFGPQKK